MQCIVALQELVPALAGSSRSLFMIYRWVCWKERGYLGWNCLGVSV